MQKIARIFFVIAGILLLFTAAAKIVSSIGGAAILRLPDPIFAIQFRWLLLVVAGAELFVALTCFLGRSMLLQALSVVWLSLSFLGYRAGESILGYHQPCNCLGTITQNIGISDRTAELSLKVVLGFLLIGSCTILIWLYTGGHRTMRSLEKETAESQHCCGAGESKF